MRSGGVILWLVGAWILVFTAFVVWVLGAVPIWAQERDCWSPTESYYDSNHVCFQPSGDPDAHGEVRFWNYPHTRQLPLFTLTLDGVTVTVTADLGDGTPSDSITVDPPAGYIAVPRTIEVDEALGGPIRDDAIQIYPEDVLLGF